MRPMRIPQVAVDDPISHRLGIDLFTPPQFRVHIKQNDFWNLVIQAGFDQSVGMRDALRRATKPECLDAFNLKERGVNALPRAEERNSQKQRN